MVGESYAWKQVTKKKRQYSFNSQLGKANIGPNSKFKAASIKIPIYISNVSIDTNENDIINYIRDRIHEDVKLFKINRQSKKAYNSYKMYICKHKLGIVLDDMFWPDGITFRRFVYDNVKSKNGLSQQKHT